MNKEYLIQPAHGASYESPERRYVQEDDTDIIDLGQLLRTLWHGKYLLVFLAVFGTAVGWFYANYMATPQYTAKTVVLLDPQTNNVAGLSSVSDALSSDATTINSEIQVLSSRILLGRVVDQLDLTSDPEFNSTLREPSLRSRTVNAVKSLVGMETPPRTPLDPESEAAKENAINRLLGKLTIRVPSTTRVFEIIVQSENPAMARQISDTIADVYVQSQVTEKYEATEAATNWLSNRVSELQTELESAQAALKAFSAETNLVSQEALATMEVRIKELRDRASAMERTLAAASSRLEALRGATTMEERLAVADDGQLSDIAARVENGAPMSLFETRYQQIVSRAELEETRAENQLSALQETLGNLEQEFSAQSEDLIRLQQLTRESEATRLLYESFLTSLKETSVQQGVQQADSRILSRAVDPGAPSSPKKKLLQIVGAALAIMAGAAYLLLRELTAKSFRTSSQIESHTGGTVLGQIPLLKRRKPRDVLQYLAEHPTSAAAEAIRNLRTSLMLSQAEKAPQVIMLTSSVPGEGKSTLSLALAQNFSGLGRKVLVIEGDTRRRVFGLYLDEAGKRGFQSVMRGEAVLDDAIGHVDWLGCDVMMAEESRSSAADVFASRSFETMLADLRSRYDLIVIDTPPVLVVPDSRVVAQHADSVLYVVRWNETAREQVSAGMHMFDSINCRIDGFVLNQISPKGMKRYGYGERYGAYASYGANYYRGS
jgi:succinoglycan biosynthesis transport protein ExoP